MINRLAGRNAFKLTVAATPLRTKKFHCTYRQYNIVTRKLDRSTTEYLQDSSAIQPPDWSNRCSHLGRRDRTPRKTTRRQIKYPTLTTQSHPSPSHQSDTPT